MEYARVEDLLNKTLVSVERLGDEEIIFTTDNGEKFHMYYERDCCNESVTIEDIVGDLSDLVGAPILLAEKVTYKGDYTWTFYKFATRKGYVDIRWFGESNGFYSEEVYFEKR